jgi:hypothetical protein
MSKLHTDFWLVFAAGCATILSLYVFYNHPQLIALSHAVLGLIMLAVIRSRRYLIWYAVAFILGPIILDIPGMYFGIWSYGTPQIFGFPFWLPFFYGNITVSFLYFALKTQIAERAEAQ